LLPSGSWSRRHQGYWRPWQIAFVINLAPLFPWRTSWLAQHDIKVHRGQGLNMVEVPWRLIDVETVVFKDHVNIDPLGTKRLNRSRCQATAITKAVPVTWCQGLMEDESIHMRWKTGSLKRAGSSQSSANRCGGDFTLVHHCPGEVKPHFGPVIAIAPAPHVTSIAAKGYHKNAFRTDCNDCTCATRKPNCRNEISPRTRSRSDCDD
jgi:hypothetical protein